MYENVRVENFTESRDCVLVRGDARAKREWATLAIKPRSNLNYLYRLLEETQESDLAKLAPWFAMDGITDAPEPTLKQYRYELRQIWRFLHRRYSCKAPIAVSKALYSLKEPMHWRVWRYKDWFLPPSGDT